MKNNGIKLDSTMAVKILWQNKLTILVFIVLFSGCSITYSYIIAKEIFEVNCIIKPAAPSDETTISGLSAGLGGFLLANSKETEVQKDIRMTMGSRSFLLKIYRRYQHDRRMFGDKLWKIDKESLTAAAKSEKKAETALQIFKKIIIIDSQAGDNVIKISILLENKYFAMNFLKDYLEILKNEVKQNNLKILNEDIAFYQKTINESKNAIIAEELQKILFKKINKSCIMSANVFSINEEPVIPYKRYSPKRMQIVFVFTVLGFFTGIIMVFAKITFQNLKLTFSTALNDTRR